jgi:hypothetical protein
MAKLKIATNPTITGVTYPQPAGDTFVTPIQVNGKPIGGTGGPTSRANLQIAPSVNIKWANGGGSYGTAAGSITAQKGSHKYRVTDGTHSGTCTLVNSPTLAAGQMNLWANVCIIPSATMGSSNVAGGATSATITWSSTPIGPVATPRVGDYIVGFSSSSIGAYGANVTAVNSATSVTVWVSGNVAAQTTLANAMTLVSRIDNNYIHDFISDGQMDSTNGTITYYPSGYNPTKFRYVLGGNAISASATITGGFARVISA